MLLCEQTTGDFLWLFYNNIVKNREEYKGNREENNNVASPQKNFHREKEFGGILRKNTISSATREKKEMTWKLKMLLPPPPTPIKCHFYLSTVPLLVDPAYWTLPIRRFYALPVMSMRNSTDCHIPKKTNAKPTLFYYCLRWKIPHSESHHSKLITQQSDHILL